MIDVDKDVHGTCTVKESGDKTRKVKQAKERYKGTKEKKSSSSLTWNLWTKVSLPLAKDKRCT